jgi:hypothetical protein
MMNIAGLFRAQCHASLLAAPKILAKENCCIPSPGNKRKKSLKKNEIALIDKLYLYRMSDGKTAQFIKDLAIRLSAIRKKRLAGYY